MEPGNPRGDHPKELSPLPELLAGRYRIGGVVGEGGMGEVCRAWDTTLQRWVAIKRLTHTGRGGADRAREILHEARLIARIRHPAIVAVYDVLEEKGEVLLVEEFVEGVSLRKEIGRPIAVARFLEIAEECAGALTAAGAEGIIHCDLKPENILVTRDGHTRILDFGVARRCLAAPRPARPREPLPVPGSPTENAAGFLDSPTVPFSRPEFQGGTLDYASPEVLIGETADQRADIFSLGVVFYEMLTAHHPFRRATVAATLAAIVRDPVEIPSLRNPEVPPALDALLLRMLEKDREARPSGGQELGDDLSRVRDRLADRSAHPDGVPALSSRDADAAGRGRRHGRRAAAPWRGLARPQSALAFVGVAALVGAVVLILSSTRREAREDVEPPPYLAVEAFRSLSHDPADALFALGLTEAVQTRLASLDGVQVVSASAGVGSRILLQGTLQRSAQELRISYRLVDVERGVNFAGALVEGRGEEIFRLQDEVTQGIATALAERFGLSGSLEVRTPGPPTGDLQAYDLYLQARGYLQRPGDAQDAEVAVGLFRRARELDPRFTLAQAGLGEAYWRLHTETRDASWAAMAEAAARVAADEDPGLPEVQITLGIIHLGRGKAEDAAACFQRALVLDPRSSAAFRGLAQAQEAQGDADLAEQTYLAAIRARPADWSGYSHLGSFYFRQGNATAALANFEQVVALTPDNVRGYSNLGAVLQELGRTEDATRAYERSLRLDPNYRAFANLATLYRFEGRLEEAASYYEQALALDARDYRVWGSLAGTYRQITGRAAAADSADRRAIALAEDRLSVNPNDALVLAHLAMYESELGDEESARVRIARAVGAQPGHPEVLFAASNVYLNLGEIPRALELVDAAMRAGCAPTDWQRDPAMARLVRDPEFGRLAEPWAESLRVGR